MLHPFVFEVLNYFPKLNYYILPGNELRTAAFGALTLTSHSKWKTFKSTLDYLIFNLNNQ